MEESFQLPTGCTPRSAAGIGPPFFPVKTAPSALWRMWGDGPRRLFPRDVPGGGGDKGLAIVSSCSHNGIVNIARSAMAQFPGKPIRYIVGVPPGRVLPAGLSAGICGRNRQPAASPGLWRPSTPATALYSPRLQHLKKSGMGRFPPLTCKPAIPWRWNKNGGVLCENSFYPWLLSACSFPPCAARAPLGRHPAL